MSGGKRVRSASDAGAAPMTTVVNVIFGCSRVATEAKTRGGDNSSFTIYIYEGVVLGIVIDGKLVDSAPLSVVVKPKTNNAEHIPAEMLEDRVLRVNDVLRLRDTYSLPGVTIGHAAMLNDVRFEVSGGKMSADKNQPEFYVHPRPRSAAAIVCDGQKLPYPAPAPFAPLRPMHEGGIFFTVSKVERSGLRTTVDPRWRGSLDMGFTATINIGGEDVRATVCVNSVPLRVAFGLNNTTKDVPAEHLKAWVAFFAGLLSTGDSLWYGRVNLDATGAASGAAGADAVTLQIEGALPCLPRAMEKFMIPLTADEARALVDEGAIIPPDTTLDSDKKVVPRAPSGCLHMTRDPSFTPPPGAVDMALPLWPAPNPGLVGQMGREMEALPNGTPWERFCTVGKETVMGLPEVVVVRFSDMKMGMAQVQAKLAEVVEKMYAATRRADAMVANAKRMAADAALADRVVAVLRAAGPGGLATDDLAGKLGGDAADISRVVGGMLSLGQVAKGDDDRYTAA